MENPYVLASKFAQMGREEIGLHASLEDIAEEIRSRTESLVQRVSARPMVTAYGTFMAHAYKDLPSDNVHLALIRGEWPQDHPVLVRVHEPLSVMDLLDTGSTAHSWNVHDALSAIARVECGVLLLLHRQESASELLERARPPGERRGTPKITLRNYGIGAQILKDLGVKKMRVMSVPRRMPSMAGFDLEVTGYQEPPKAP